MGDLSGKIFVPVAVPVGSMSKSARLSRVETPGLQVAEIQAEIRIATVLLTPPLTLPVPYVPAPAATLVARRVFAVSW